ncbi:MAG: hypothetical protein VX938_13430, partial [Myxococcota bacterium]|nr:hypothetical protein [Myxococcota bacterium]
TYSMWTMLRADEGVGPGEIRVRSIDGRLVGSFPFSRRLKTLGGVSVEDTEASIHQVSSSVIGEVTHEVRVTPVNGFNEVVGGTAQVDVDVQGGTLNSPPYMESQGKFVAPIVAEPGSHPLTASVWVDGELVAELETTVNIPLPPTAPEEPNEEPDVPDVVAETGDSQSASPVEDSDPVSPQREDDGCEGGGSGGALLWWALCLLLVPPLRRGCSTVRSCGGESWSP